VHLCVGVRAGGLASADKVNKTSFPKIQDKGDISASVTFSAQIKFSLLPDKDGSVSVTGVACGFKITNFDIRVLSGNNKTMFKMLIGVFQGKLTESVGECTDSSLPVYLQLARYPDRRHYE
jgi:hypothetical protein